MDKLARLYDNTTDIIDRLGREAWVVGGGLTDGTAAALEEAWENKTESALKMGAGFALAAALVSVQRRAPGLLIAGETVGTILGYKFLTDIGIRSGAVSQAISDTWNDRVSDSHSRAMCADALGTFAADALLMTAGSMAGLVTTKSLLRTPSTLLERSASPGGSMPAVTGETMTKLGSRQSAPARSTIPAADVVLISQDANGAKPVADPPLTFDAGIIEPIDLVHIETTANRQVQDLYHSAWASVARVRKLTADGHSLGEGTGFFINKGGHAVTNFHVVANAERISVIEADGTLRTAQVVASDPATDLALLHVERCLRPPGGGKLITTSFQPLRMAFNEMPIPGQKLFAFGHNTAFSGLTVAEGTVSAVSRFGDIKFAEFPARIAVDQPVIFSRMGLRKGFSGGPVLNERGEVVAVNFAANERGNSYQIPIDAIKRIFNPRTNQLVFTGKTAAAESAELQRLPEEAAGVFRDYSPHVLKLRGIQDGLYRYTSGFLLDNGHILVDHKFASETTNVTANQRGLWAASAHTPQHYPELGASILRTYGLDYGTKAMPLAEAPIALPAKGQRLFALGFPEKLLDVHVLAGDMAGAGAGIPAHLSGKGGTFLNARIPSESGFGGAPVFNRKGDFVGATIGETATDSQTQLVLSVRAIRKMLESSQKKSWW